jgi:hypothetical protein
LCSSCRFSVQGKVSKPVKSLMRFEKRASCNKLLEILFKINQALNNRWNMS